MRTKSWAAWVVWTGSILITAVTAASAQEYGGSMVRFHNQDSKAVKVCIYAGGGETYPLAIRCLTLKPGEIRRWDREVHTFFTLYVFDPALLDNFRCKRTRLDDPAHIEIPATAMQNCVRATARRLIPPPDPNKPPPVSRSDNMLMVCNISNPEPVFFAITFATGQTGHFTEGWWRLIKNQCTEINLEDRWYKQKLPPHFRFKTYIYAETAGTLGGAVKKVWEGDDPKFTFCINDDKTKEFGNKDPEATDGVVWESDCNAANKKRMVKMWPVEVPKLGNLWKWNF